jgi:trimeric autotransporter adhesin
MHPIIGYQLSQDHLADRHHQAQCTDRTHAARQALSGPGPATTCRSRAGARLHVFAPRRWSWPGLLTVLAVVLTALIIPPAAAAVRVAAGPAVAPARPQAVRGLPVAAVAPVSRALGRNDPAYQAQATARGLTAANPRQRLRAQFSRSGMRVRSGPLAVGLSLRGIGYAPQLAALRPVAPVAAGNQVTFRYPGVREWYANGPAGLEQGFTLTTPPPGPAQGPLTLALVLSGNARAALLPGGTVVFSRAGSTLAYRGLVASDARGRRLPARLALRGRHLLLHIQAAGARYPLTVDPVIQQARLTASDGAAGDMLGTATAISADGTTIVAGSPGATINGHSAQGAVYVFAKPATGWQNATQTAKLTASGGAAGDLLGGFGNQGANSVAVSATGATIVAGAAGAYNGAPGAVYVFTRPSTGWHNQTQAAKLTASHGGPTDNLGASVAISGNVIASGAPEATVNGQQIQGAVYIFTKPSGGWCNETQAAKLTAANGAQGDYLGDAVGISGPIVVAGFGATVNGNQGQGAGYVFTKPGTGWHNETQTAKLTASDGAAGDGLGTSVAISGTVILLGAPNAGQNQGAAYVFTKPGTGWHNETQTAKLTTAPGGAGLLGAYVALSGPLAAASANNAIYLFAKPGTGWHNETQTAEATSSDFLGYTANLAGHTLVAGSWSTTVGGNTNQGTVDVFTYTASGPRQPSVDTASTPTRPDRPAPCLAPPHPAAPPHPIRWPVPATHTRCR